MNKAMKEATCHLAIALPLARPATQEKNESLENLEQFPSLTLGRKKIININSSALLRQELEASL